MNNEKYRGFVTLPRDIQTMPIWDNPYDTTLWLYCLLHAYHQDYGDIHAGQFYASQKKIADELNWSRKTVGTSLQRLEQKGMLYVLTSDMVTAITVANWNEISSGRGVSGNMVNESHCESDHGDDRSTDEEAKKQAERELEIRLSQFERFWDMYPNKRDKAETKRTFMELTDDPELVINATYLEIQTEQWQMENGRFVPSPIKWLDGMWDKHKKFILETGYNYEKESWTTE